MTAAALALDWLNQGGQQLEADPVLAQELMRWGLVGLPEESCGYFNLGIALHQQRRIAAAIRAYEKSLSLENSPYWHASNNLAQDLLLSGDFKRGWELYERRLGMRPEKFAFFEHHAGPAWLGENDPQGLPKHLVLPAEQGFGDMLQFSRFALSMQALGVHTTIFCSAGIMDLLREWGDFDAVEEMVEDDIFDNTTRWCPLMSLPHRLGIHSANVPYTSGYLRADANQVSAWRARLKRRAGHSLIGLHWQGNPKHEQSLYSRGRSMSFDQWLPLKDLEGVEFVSIQKGAGSEQLRTDAGLAFVAGQGDFDASFDFRDTGAVLANCDLLISADSGVVHLAGALGVPTWVPLRWIPEWRWLLDGEATHWYDSVRLFRQPRNGDWDSVVDRIKGELKNLRHKQAAIVL
jgi:tetratricopeptide (TPR) repeat protein